MDLALDPALSGRPSDIAPTGATAPPAGDLEAGKALRGPMRPGALASTRLRMSGRSLTRRFKALDLAALLVIAPVALHGGVEAALAAPVRLALAPVTGSVVVYWMLRTLGAYALPPHETLWRHLLKVCGAWAAGAAAAIALALVLGGGLEVAGLWSGLCLAALAALHVGDWTAVKGFRKAGRLTPNVVVVGATPNASHLIEQALKTGDAAILGVFDDRMSRIPPDIHGVRVLGDTKALLTHKLLPYVDRIIITVTPSAQARISQLIDRLKFLPNAVTLFMDVEGVDAQRATLSRLASAPLTQVSGVREDDARADAKRLQDLALGGLGLMAALPVMGLIALAVRLDSPGPIFFRQRRHGFNNEAINVWKFRSMRHEAADAHAARQVSAGDDRVTRVGRVIRKLSLDELPQLFNVVRGEMSLVGPRPPRHRHEDGRRGFRPPGGRIRLASPHEAGPDRLGAGERLGRCGGYARARPPARGPRHRIHRAPVVLVRPLDHGRHHPLAHRQQDRGALG